MDEDDEDVEAVERFMAEYLARFSPERLTIGAERIRAKITPEISDLEREARQELLRMIDDAKRRQFN